MANRSRGYLPHIDIPGYIQHVIFRTADALPDDVRDFISDDPEQRFAEVARLLRSGIGARPLANPVAADIVSNALRHFVGERYELFAWCVMPNHVHVVLRAFPGCSLSTILHSWKSYSAKAINAQLGRSGQVWSREWYDRAMRDEAQMEATVRYVERNPVAAGLAARAEDWKWSSASHS